MKKYARLAEFRQKTKSLAPVNAAIVCPESSVVLAGVLLAAEQKNIIPILIGNKTKINQVAQELGKDISRYQLIDLPDMKAAKQAVKLAQQGLVQTIVKGSLHTADFMHALVQRDSGLRTARRMSHCQVLDIPTYKKLLIITDPAVNIFPNIEEKKDIIQNAIDLAIKLGVSQPKVALLSAVENINPAIKTTVECVELCKMDDITGGIVEGPMGFDLAVSEDAVKVKKFKTQVGGDADILVAPNIEAGNILMKTLDYFADSVGMSIVLGAKIPIVLTSRSANALERSYSCMLAKFLHYHESV